MTVENKRVTVGHSGITQMSANVFAGSYEL